MHDKPKIFAALWYQREFNRARKLFVLETVCMVMEALKGFQSKFNFDVYGHSGEDESVALIESGKVPENEKQRLQVLQLMHAHSQFCLSGDSTVAACQRAVSDLSAIDADERYGLFMVWLLFWHLKLFNCGKGS